MDGVSARPGALQTLLTLAKRAESGGIDALVFRDANNAGLVREGCAFLPYEPFTAFAALAAATDRIGLAAAVSPRTSQPYNVARRLATIDHISRGRAGWHITPSADQQQEQYGDLSRPPVEAVAARDAEFLEVVHQLWDSWSPDAIVIRSDGRVKVNGEGNGPIDHRGHYFSVKGPLDVPRPPQGRPVLFHSVVTEDDMDMAARFADVVIAEAMDLEATAKFADEMSLRLKSHARDRADVRIMPVLGSTNTCTAEAVTERITQWHGAGIIDGFSLAGTCLNGFIDEVMPLLRQAGMLPEKTGPSTLRERLGLKNLYME